MDKAAPDFSLPDTLTGPHIRLTTVCVEDAPALFALIDANREHLGRFLTWPATIQSVEDEVQFIERRIKQQQAGMEHAYLICTRHDDAAIGMVGVFGIAWEHRTGEIGYWLAEHASGNGHMTESVEILHKALFCAGLHRLEIQCETSNHPSAGIARRLGYRHEGTHRHAQIRDGRPRDMLVFARLSDDA